MILAFKDSTIKKEKFDNKLFDTDGTLVTAYTINTVSDETGTTLDGYDVQMSGSTSFVPGDSVIVVEPDGMYRKNVVEQVGVSIIRFQERLSSFAPNRSVTVKPDYVSITLNLTDNKIYRFTDNEALIISPSFVNNFVNFASISNRYGSLASDANIELMNSEAKESIFGDFSFEPFFFRKLGLGQIRELLLLKICALVERRDGPLDATIHQEAYEKYLAKMVNIVAVDEDGVLDPDIMEEGANAIFDFDFGWGE